MKVQVNDKGSSSNHSSESSKDNVSQAEARRIDASNTDPGTFVPFGILSNSIEVILIKEFEAQWQRMEMEIVVIFLFMKKMCGY